MSDPEARCARCGHPESQHYSIKRMPSGHWYIPDKEYFVSGGRCRVPISGHGMRMVGKIMYPSTYEYDDCDAFVPTPKSEREEVRGT
jgi:hypothetical protein